MAKSLHVGRFHLGACYYPEHWPEELWPDDYRRMREMGLETIGDLATADLYTEISRTADKQLWFLEAHLQDRE